MLFTPIKALRLRYLPPLMLYFAYGASTFSGIAESFFVKEHLNLSAESLIMLGVWLTLPWTTKMIFGQFVDSVPFCRSIRKSYIYFAAFLMVIGSVLLAGLAGEWRFVMAMGHANGIYIASSLIMVIGVVIQDVVADAMSVEVVPTEGRSRKEVDKELAMVQLLGRLSLNVAMFIVIGLGGWLAHHLSYQTMFLLTLIIPVISISGSLFIKINPQPVKPVNWTILGWAFVYLLFLIVMAASQMPYHQEIIFVVSLAVVIYLLKTVARGLPEATIKSLICAAIVIFVFRAMPSVGPGLSWWEIDVLGFSKAFFGVLGQIGTGLAVLGMWFFAKQITQKPIGVVLVTLTIILFLLSLPVIGLYYGLHIWTEEMFGFGARTIAIIDTALASPFAQLSMIPMLTLIAVNAPKGNVATWFALMASLMNLALTTGGLVSKQLNKIWVVSREVLDASGHVIVNADYSQLGVLLWITTIAGLVLPILAVYLLLPEDIRRKQVKT